MGLIKLKNYFINFFILTIFLILSLLIVNFLILNFPSQKFYPRSLANSLPNFLVTFYPDTYKKNNLENYIAIVGDSYSQGNGDGYLNGTYDYSIGHHLHKNDDKNYLIFGRAGFGSISAVSNLVKLNKISNLPIFFKNLNKPESIIFFFYEGNDLEDNFFEYSSLSNINEDINSFVLRRIKENTSLTTKDKLTSFFPLISIMDDLYDHIHILFNKLLTNDENENKKSLIIDRIKKLFGFTILLDSEKKNEEIYINSIKNKDNYNNIKPLHSAAANLTNEEISISLKIFFESVKYIKSWIGTDEILIVYIPSPISCYVWDEPIEYTIKNSETIKFLSNKENDLKSEYIREEIENFSKKNNINFLDIAQHIKEENINRILHGPLDWMHFNYDGYKIVSDYIINNT